MWWYFLDQESWANQFVYLIFFFQYQDFVWGTPLYLILLNILICIYCNHSLIFFCHWTVCWGQGRVPSLPVDYKFHQGQRLCLFPLANNRRYKLKARDQFFSLKIKRKQTTITKLNRSSTTTTIKRKNRGHSDLLSWIWYLWWVVN